MNNESLKTTLRVLRLQHGLNQADLAKKIGIGTTTYARKEKGGGDFTLNEAKKISEIFNKSMEEIFFKNEVANRTTNDTKEIEATKVI